MKAFVTAGKVIVVILAALRVGILEHPLLLRRLLHWRLGPVAHHHGGGPLSGRRHGGKARDAGAFLVARPGRVASETLLLLRRMTVQVDPAARSTGMGGGGGLVDRPPQRWIVLAGGIQFLLRHEAPNDLGRVASTSSAATNAGSPRRFLLRIRSSTTTAGRAPFRYGAFGAIIRIRTTAAIQNTGSAIAILVDEIGTGRASSPSLAVVGRQQNKALYGTEAILIGIVVVLIRECSTAVGVRVVCRCRSMPVTPVPGSAGRGGSEAVIGAAGIQRRFLLEGLPGSGHAPCARLWLLLLLLWGDGGGVCSFVVVILFAAAAAAGAAIASFPPSNHLGGGGGGGRSSGPGCTVAYGPIRILHR
jgi:hypothetical protein